MAAPSPPLLSNSAGNMSATVVLFVNFFGNVAGGNPTPLNQQDVTLIHEFIHSKFNLGGEDHTGILKKFHITRAKGQSSSDALDDWISHDCTNK